MAFKKNSLNPKNPKDSKKNENFLVDEIEEKDYKTYPPGTKATKPTKQTASKAAVHAIPNLTRNGLPLLLRFFSLGLLCKQAKYPWVSPRTHIVERSSEAVRRNSSAYAGLRLHSRKPAKEDLWPRK